MLINQIICLGVNHRTAPVEIRERLGRSLLELDEQWRNMSGSVSNGRSTAINELVLLSTCNRLELYAHIDGAPKLSDLAALLDRVYGVDLLTYGEHLYMYAGETAVSHLYRVAAGLDSLVMGEPQILGQVNEAYMAAMEARTAGSVLSTLFRAAVRAGKRARTETAISHNPASVGSVAIALAQERVGDLRRRQVLVVGLGEMGLLSLKALRARGITQIIVANRSRQRAEAVAEKWGYMPYSLAELPLALAQADVVISATSTHSPIISAAMVREALAQRPDRELTLIDLAVPRDVETAVRDLPGVSLFDVDDLRGTLDEALAARQQEAPRVEAILAAELAMLTAELQALAVRPLISDLRQKAEHIRQQELARTLRYLGDVEPETLNHIQHLSRSLVNKLLHEPTLLLREKAQNGQADEYETAVRHLFGLENE